MMKGERSFIDGEWRVVREDHGVILGQPNMEGVAKDLRIKLRECTMNVGDVMQMESQSHLILKVMGEIRLVNSMLRF